MENLYESDFHGWIQQQASLLRQGRFTELDINNLIEEVECMGGSERSTLTSHLMQLLMHLLKWQHQPERRSRSWRDSIINHRYQATITLSENPSMKHYLPEIYEKAYKRAVTLAVKQTGLAKKTFPAQCSWTYEQVIKDDWLP